MCAEPLIEDGEDRSRYAGVLRFYHLAKHAEWQVKDVPWGELPPVPEGKGSPQRLARRRFPAQRLSLIHWRCCSTIPAIGTTGAAAPPAWPYMRDCEALVIVSNRFRLLRSTA